MNEAIAIAAGLTFAAGYIIGSLVTWRLTKAPE